MVKHRLLLAVLAGLMAAASPALADRGWDDHDGRRGPPPGWDRGPGRDWDGPRGHGWGHEHHDDGWRRGPPVVVMPPPPPRVVYAPPPRVYYLDPYPGYPVVIGRPLPPGIRYHRAPMMVVERAPVCRTGVECILVGTDLLVLDAVHGVVRSIIYGGGRF